MSFYDTLVYRKEHSILHEVIYNTPPFYNLERVLYRLKKAKDEKILIITDPDVDGLFAAITTGAALNILSYSDVTVTKYINRSHLLSEYGIELAIKEKFDLVIILDTATNELEKIRRLTDNGIDVIVLDHHQTELDYSVYWGGVYVINPSIENKTNDVYRLSAGGVAFCVFNELLMRNNIHTNILATYALTTLYSDSMDMENILNRAIYFKALSNDYFPPQFKPFITERTVLSRRFLSFRFINKINALFRAERFDLINRYMTSDRITIKDIAEIEKIHKESRELVDLLFDRAKTQDYGNVVFSDISDIKLGVYEDYNLENYTGLLANKLSESEGKPAVVVYKNKGSFRDILSRPYLNTFKKFSDSNGHQSAFGIRVNDLDSFIENLKNIKPTSYKTTNPIIMCGEELTEEDIDDMAFFNEFSTISLPPALIEVDTSELERVYDKFYKAYKWKGFKVKADIDLKRYPRAIIKPEHNDTVQMYSYAI